MTVLGNSVLYDSGYLPFCSLAPPERSESSAPHGALSNMHRTAEPVSLPPLSSIVWFISTPSVTPVSGWELYKGRPDPDSISYACHCISSLFTGYLSVTFFQQLGSYTLITQTGSLEEKYFNLLHKQHIFFSEGEIQEICSNASFILRSSELALEFFGVMLGHLW